MRTKRTDLILENIRLKHMEMLLNEASTDLEVIRGTRIINESILMLGNMLEENLRNGQAAPDPAAAIIRKTIRTAGIMPIAGALVGGAIGNEIHGNDGINQTTGVMTDPARNEDDEYDMTGAALGGLAGLGASGKYLRSKNFRVTPSMGQ